MDERSMENLGIAEKTEQAARGHFREGFNCAECVLLGYMDTHDTGMSSDILTLITGFGGGIGRTRNICGAISGAVMSLGFEKGRKNPCQELEPKERAAELGTIYPIFADLVNEIKDHYGTLLCSELSAPFEDFDGRERKKNCQEIVGFCAGLAAKHAEK